METLFGVPARWRGSRSGSLRRRVRGGFTGTEEAKGVRRPVTLAGSQADPWGFEHNGCDALVTQEEGNG